MFFIVHYCADRSSFISPDLEVLQEPSYTLFKPFPVSCQDLQGFSCYKGASQQSSCILQCVTFKTFSLGVTFMAKIFEFFRETRDSSQERASYSYASSTGNMLMSSCIILFTMSTSSVKHISVLTFAISARNDSRAVANGNMISFAW